jgi:hypothetical protein
MLNFPLSAKETHHVMKPALRAVHFFPDCAGIVSVRRPVDTALVASN